MNKESKNPNMRGLTASILATVFERMEIKTRLGLSEQVRICHEFGSDRTGQEKGV